MESRNAQIVNDMSTLKENTELMNNSMNEMSYGARKINDTGASLSDVSALVKDSIKKIGDQVDLFKV